MYVDVNDGAQNLCYENLHFYSFCLQPNGYDVVKKTFHFNQIE